jgi:hypothetical protein
MSHVLESRIGHLVRMSLIGLGLSFAFPAYSLFNSPPADPEVNENREISLRLPAPDQVPVLPNARRYVIWDSIANNDGWPFGHGAMVSVFKGRVICAWYITNNFEAQDYPRELKILTTSAPISNLKNWTPPVDIEQANPRTKYFDYLLKKHGKQVDPEKYIFVPRGMLVTDDTLYLFTLSYLAWPGQADGRVFKSNDGILWTEIDGMELDRKKDFLVRDSAFNHHSVRLKDGRWMAPMLGKDANAPITGDPTGLSGWQGGEIDCSACSDVGEPAGWQGPDGVIHYAARYGRQVWHAWSEDQGRTWTKLAPQEKFTDAPGNKEFGPLAGNGVWYVGNPYPSERRHLVFAVSRDGWDFDKTWMVRWEDWQDRRPPVRANLGYDYPSGVFHGGRIYLFYSTDNRQRMELTVADLAGLLK